MTEPSSVMNSYGRILSINWQQRNSFDRDLHPKLMAEYLRRAALWAKAISPAQPPSPFFDIAERISPTTRADLDLIEKLLHYLRQFPLNLQEQRVCERALHWSAINNTTEVKQFALPEPFEPLLVLFEQGGTFRTEHGWIDVDGTGFSSTNWLEYADKSPLLDLDS